MAPRRILLIERTGTYRDALERVLISEGHEVRVTDKGSGDLLKEFRPDVILASPDDVPGRSDGVELIVLVKPVNLEELRQALRAQTTYVAGE
jgi:DNA-binding response OmpR family regulator